MSKGAILFLGVIVVSVGLGIYRHHHPTMPDFAKDYRIVTNGEGYEVEQRFLYFFWATFATPHYEKLEDAELEIRVDVDLDQAEWRKTHGPWKPVTIQGESLSSARDSQ